MHCPAPHSPQGGHTAQGPPHLGVLRKHLSLRQGFFTQRSLQQRQNELGSLFLEEKDAQEKEGSRTKSLRGWVTDQTCQWSLESSYTKI